MTKLIQEEVDAYLGELNGIDLRAKLWERREFEFITQGLDEDGVACEHHKQKEALEILTSNKYEEFLYGGAAGGAKSWTGCVWLLFMCIQYPNTKYFIARNELKDIIDSVLVTFYKVCRAYGFTDFNFNAQKNFIQFGNGSHINFIELKFKPSDKMYEDVGSTEYTAGWIEEVGEIHPVGARVISSRVGRHLNNKDIDGRMRKEKIKGIVLYTCNPKKNWAKVNFYDADKKGNIKPHRKYLSCLITENPFIEKDYVTKLKRLADSDKSLYERLFKGNWDYEDNPNSLCEYDMIEQIWENDHVPGGTKYLTADVARYGSDMAIIFVWDGWIVIEMITFKISKTTEIENAILLMRRKHGIPKNRCCADEDGVGCLEESMEVLTEKGWKKSIDITKRDYIVSKDENGRKEYVKPFEIIHHEKEKFVRINDDIAFTVSHLHFYKTRRENKIKAMYWDELSEFKAFYNDQEITPITHTNEFVFFESTKGYNNVLYFSKYLFSSFLGWVLSDGYLDNYNNKNVIGISQSINSPNNNQIEDILNRMGVKWRVDVQRKELNQYSFQHKALFDWIADNCYVGNKYNFKTKRLPKILKDASKQNFLAFCESFISGDGYYHKGKMQFTGTNKVLLDEIQVGLFMNGINSRIYIKHKKGSIGTIDGRSFVRKRNGYLLSEISHPSRYKINKTEVFFDRSVNIKIPNKTRALLVRKGKHTFWTHNGGVVDGTGILGFVNNSRAIRQKGKDQNYANLKTQCMYLLADKINDGGIWLNIDISNDRKQVIQEELDQIQSANKDDRKLHCKSKDDIKGDIDRSPDYMDALLMRFLFELKPTTRRGFYSKPRVI